MGYTYLDKCVRFKMLIAYRLYFMVNYQYAFKHKMNIYGYFIRLNVHIYEWGSRGNILLEWWNQLFVSFTFFWQVSTGSRTFHKKEGPIQSCVSDSLYNQQNFPHEKGDRPPLDPPLQVSKKAGAIYPLDCSCVSSL